MRSINEILSLVCGFLNREKIDYVVVGGIAVIFYGNPRTTVDAGIILRTEENKIKKFVELKSPTVLLRIRSPCSD